MIVTYCDSDIRLNPLLQVVVWWRCCTLCCAEAKPGPAGMYKDPSIADNMFSLDLSEAYWLEGPVGGLLPTVAEAS